MVQVWANDGEETVHFIVIEWVRLDRDRVFPNVGCDFYRARKLLGISIRFFSVFHFQKFVFLLLLVHMY